MQHAVFYGSAPIARESKIVVSRGAFDAKGTLIISEMICLDTGITWTGTLVPPGVRSILPARRTAFSKTSYRVESIDISAKRNETVFELEKIPDPGN